VSAPFRLPSWPFAPALHPCRRRSPGPVLPAGSRLSRVLRPGPWRARCGLRGPFSACLPYRLSAGACAPPPPLVATTRGSSRRWPSFWPPLPRGSWPRFRASSRSAHCVLRPSGPPAFGRGVLPPRAPAFGAALVVLRLWFFPPLALTWWRPAAVPPAVVLRLPLRPPPAGSRPSQPDLRGVSAPRLLLGPCSCSRLRRALPRCACSRSSSTNRDISNYAPPLATAWPVPLPFASRSCPTVVVRAAGVL